MLKNGKVFTSAFKLFIVIKDITELRNYIK